MVLNQINSTAPTTPFPLTNTTTNAVINPGFTPTFQRTLFEVVPNPTPGSGFGIPAYLQPLFGPTGFTCTNTTAQQQIKNYGYLVLPTGTAAGDCGSTS
jgi:hypothetical protein